MSVSPPQRELVHRRNREKGLWHTRLSNWALCHTGVLLWSLALAQLVAYALVQPIWSRVDEAQHFHYVQYLAENRGLPVTGKTFISSKVVEVSLIVDQWGWNPAHTVDPPTNIDPQSWQTVPADLQGNERWDWIAQNLWYFNYEAMQPPLYYAIGAVAYTALPDNPFVQIYVLRVLSAMLASFTVAIAYATMRKAAPGHRLLAWAVPATVALIPGFVLNLAQITNDTLATSLSALVFYLLVCVLRPRQGDQASSGPLERLVGPTDRLGFRNRVGLAVPAPERFGLKESVLIGGLIGLGLLTKVTTVYLIPVALVAVGLTTRSLSRDALARVVTAGAILIATPVAVVSPWLVRNWLTYGDLTGSAEASGLLGAIFPPAGLDSLDGIRNHLSGSLDHLVRTFWFGEPFSPWQYWENALPVFIALSYIALPGLAFFFWRSSGRRWNIQQKAVFLMVAVVLLHVTELLIAPAFGGLGVVGRYLYPSIIPIAGLLWLGLLSLSPRRIQKYIVFLILVALAALNVVNFITYIQSSA